MLTRKICADILNPIEICMQDNDMNFIYKLNICKDETDKMEKNYKRGIEVLHRKMIFDMQRIFKYSGVISRFLILNHLLPRDHI